ncbi:unnamed protein product [Rhizoctonia solani]|uniref:Uncharacterized protein n=1 Tax=Rhizoctonia solani TaxID=456999 RepID=A0A8H3C5R5_9AGAM|nr:unnamed protein product [Rhizoctonia solani]
MAFAADMAPKAKKPRTPAQPKAQSGNTPRSAQSAKSTIKGKGRSNAQSVGSSLIAETAAQPKSTIKGKGRSNAQSVESSSIAGKAAQPVDETDSFNPILEEEAFWILWEKAKEDCTGRGNAPPTSKTPRELATDVSAEESRQVEAVTWRMQASLDQVLGQVGGSIDDFLKSVQEEADDHLDHTNPHTRQNHMNAKVSWTSILSVVKPRIPCEEHWARTTVDEFACNYLVIRFRLMPGKASKHVKAITVASWAGHIIFCIAYFTYDPKTNLKCGRQLLTGVDGKPGLYFRLIQTVKDLVDRHQLDRYPTNRYRVLGKCEFQMAIEYAMIICVMYMQFVSGVRPSAVAALHNKMIKLGRFMTLGDIKFYRVVHCKYDAHITYKHFKGSITTVLGTQAKHVYKGLSKVHNLPFDPWWLLDYYIARDALEFLNIDDLVKSTKHEILVTKPDEPFCVKVTPGGYDFVRPIQPATADNMSHQVSALLNQVGIQCSSYGFRRGAATELEITAGPRIAGLTLNHSEAATVASHHYSFGTATIDLLGIRLDKVKEPLQPGVQERMALNARIGAAVTLIAGDLADQSLDSEGKDDNDNENEEQVIKPRKSGAMAHQVNLVEKRTEQVQQTLAESNAMKDFKKVVDEEWPNFLAPFVPGSKDYKKLSNFSRGKQNITNITKNYGYEGALEKASPKVAEASKRARELLLGAYKGMADLKKSLTKSTGRRIQNENENDPNPTTKNTNQAIEHFERPSYLLEDAMDFSASKNTVSTQGLEVSDPGPLTSAGPSTNAGPSTGAGTKLMTEPASEDALKEVLAELGAQEDEDEDTIREGTEAVLTFPGLSRCGVAQDEEQVLRNYIGMDEARRKPQNTSAGGMSESPANDPLNDQQDDIPSELTTTDDQNEKQVVENLTTEQAREALMRFALAPILADREFHKHVEEDGGEIFCWKCDPFPKYQENRRKFQSRRTLNRHLPNHTEWHDLELRMHPKAGKPHGCPAVNCQKSFASVAETKVHCLSDECPEQSGFQAMKEADDIQVSLRAKREADSRRIPRFRDREAMLQQSAKALASMDEESVIQHARHYEIPEQEIQSDVVSQFVELANTIGNDWSEGN